MKRFCGQTIGLLVFLCACWKVASDNPVEDRTSSSVLPDEALLGLDLQHDDSMKTISLIPKEDVGFDLGGLKHTIRNKLVQAVLRPKARSLQGDFESFVEIFRQAQFRLPPFETTLSGGLVTVRVDNIICRDITFDDIEFGYNQVSDQLIALNMTIVGLDIICDMDFRWDMGFLGDRGTSVVTSNDNSIGTRIEVVSNDFNSYPPHDAEAGSCSADISVDDIALNGGGFIQSFVDSLDFMLNSLIEGEVSAMLCDEIGSIDALVEGMINRLSNELDPYTQPIEAWRLDPMTAERSMDLPDGVEVINFNEPDGFGRVLQSLVDEMNNYFSSEFRSRSSPTGRDLGINMFLRDNFLEDDRSLTINAANLTQFFDPTVLDVHDKLTETKLTLSNIKIFGLDSFSRFNPMERLGDQTYQFDMKWDTLSIEVNATLDIRASTLEDAFIESSGEPVIENFRMVFGADDVEFLIAAFLAVDKTALSELELGPLFFSENLVSCIASAVHDFSITGFNASIGNIHDPTLHGFLSSGLDRLITSFVEATMLMYEDVFLSVIPQMFQTKVRDSINDKFTELSSEGECLPVDIVDDFIDFRDLFLTPEDAVAFGGSGDQRYGDIMSQMFSMSRSLISGVADDGTLHINSQLIRPLTLSQSGTEGTFRYEADLISIGSGGENNSNNGGSVASALDNFIKSIRLTNARIQNLDTLTPPTEIMEPIQDDPYSLRNQIHMGPVSGRPLNASISLILELVGQDHTNEIDLSFAADSLDLLAEVFAKIPSGRLLQFPMVDLMNVNCWLAVFAPVVTGEGQATIFSRASQGEQSGRFSFNSFAAAISALSPAVVCRTCEEGSLLSELTEIFVETQTSSLLEERFGPLVESVVHGVMNNSLVEAPKFCPHSPLFEGVVKSDLQFGSMEMNVPVLDVTSIDTMAFAASTIVQVGLVLLADIYRMDDVEAMDPLSKQREFDPPRDVRNRLVDWTQLDEVDSPLITLGVEAIRSIVNPMNMRRSRSLQLFDGMLGGSNGGGLMSMFGGTSMLSGNTFDFLNFGGLFGDLIDDDGYSTLPLANVEFEVAGYMFGISSVRIGGLNTFTRFDLLDALAPQTLMNSFHLETLSLEVTLHADALATSDPPQVFTLSLDMNDVNLMVPIFAALDLEKFNSLEMGSLLVLDDILPCLMSAFYETEIVQFNITVGDMSELRVDGLLPQAESIMSNLSGSIFNRFQSSILESITSIGHNFVRPGLNMLLSGYTSGSTCQNIMATSAEDDFVDFRDLFLSEEDARALGSSGGSPYGDLLRTIYTMVKPYLEIDPNTGSALLNDQVIGPLTREQSGEAGTLIFPGEVMDEGIRAHIGGFRGTVRFAISDLRADNLDHIGRPFSLLDVISDPHQLNNTASLGVGGTPLRVTSRILIAMREEDGIDIRNDMQVSFDLHALTIVLTTLIQIAEERFGAFPVGDLLIMDCWLATLPAPRLNRHGVRRENQTLTAGLTRLAASLAQMNLQVDCNSCTSPGISEWAEILSTPEAQQDLTEMGNGFIDFAARIGQSQLFQMMIDRRISEAELRCPHSPRYDATVQEVTYRPFRKINVENSSSLIYLLIVVFASLLAISGIVALAVRLIVRRRHRKWLRSLPNQRLNQVMKQQMADDLLEADLNALSLSMFQSSDIPAYVRYFMPVVIVGNVGLFISGHLSLGATVTIIGEFAGERFEIADFFSFSIAQSTIELWNAGGTTTAIFIMIFSIIWPYTKQLITFILWFLKPSMVSVSLRGRILLWLDFLAKWSMVDVFTLVLMIAAFSVSIVSPDRAFLPENFYSLSLMVVPRWGLYANMTAQLISQISSHFIIHYHRKIINKATLRHEEKQNLAQVSNVESGNGAHTMSTRTLDDEHNDVLHRHAFARPHRGESEKLVIRRYVNYLLCAAAMLLAVLLILGCIIPSFSLEVFGVVGIAVESGQDFRESVTDQSVFSVVRLLMNQARLLDTVKDRVGLGALSGLVILCVLIVPLTETIVLLYQWFFPMTQKKRMKMSVITEILQAWQYTEVYILSALFTSWQLGPTSEFMVNPYCGVINDQLAMLVNFGILDGSDAQCFQVLATVKSATYIILAGAALLILLNSFIMRATTHYFRDKLIEKNVSVKMEEELTADLDKIHPVPTLFSDVYRWLLIGKDSTDYRPDLSGSPVKTYELSEDGDKPAKTYDLEEDYGSSDDQDANKADYQGPLFSAEQELESSAPYDERIQERAKIDGLPEKSFGKQEKESSETHSLKLNHRESKDADDVEGSWNDKQQQEPVNESWDRDLDSHDQQSQETDLEGVYIEEQEQARKMI